MVQFRFLNEIEVLYEDEGRRGYYYTPYHVSRGSSVPQFVLLLQP